MLSYLTFRANLRAFVNSLKHLSKYLQVLHSILSGEKSKFIGQLDGRALFRPLFRLLSLPVGIVSSQNSALSKLSFCIVSTYV